MAKSLRERAFSWIRKRKKERNTLTSTIKSAPSKPTRQTSEYHAPTQTKSSYSGGGGSVWNGSSRPASSGTKKETPKHAVGYRPAAKMAIGAKAKEQQTKAKSVAEAMKSSEKGLTDREKALKHNVQKAVLNVGNRVGKDYAKDLKSGLYTSKATEQEKKNVAKSIEKDYNKKAKSKKAEAVAGFTKSDANIKAVTKGVTGKDIDTSKVTKSKAYKGGEVAQELASYAIAPNEAAGKAVGKLAVKAIAKNALKKSGQKATKRVVNGAMQKAAADFAKSKGKTFASKRAGEVIANAPLNAKYAADRAKDEKTGKIDKKKFAKDFALNTGFDVGIGSAIGGVQLGKAAKVAKRSAREARMGKMLDSRIKKVTKANKTVKAEKPKVAPTTAKRVKAKVTKKSELNLGQAVKEEYAGIDKRVEKGVISKSEAKKQRKALANEFERRTGGTGVRLNKGYAEVTKKGLKEIKDSNNKLNFDRRISKRNVKSIGMKRIRERMAEQPKANKATISTTAKPSNVKVFLDKPTKKKIADNFRKRTKRAEARSEKAYEAIRARVDAKKQAEAQVKEANAAKALEEKYTIGTKARKKVRANATAKETTSPSPTGKQVKKTHEFVPKEKPELSVTTRRTKASKEADYGTTVRKYFDDIDKKKAKGEISSAEATRQKKALSKTVGDREITYRTDDGRVLRGKVSENGIEETGAALKAKNKVKRLKVEVDETPTKTKSELEAERKKLVNELYEKSKNKQTEYVSNFDKVRGEQKYKEEVENVNKRIANIDKDLYYYKKNPVTKGEANGTGTGLSESKGTLRGTSEGISDTRKADQVGVEARTDVGEHGRTQRNSGSVLLNEEQRARLDAGGRPNTNISEADHSAFSNAINSEKSTNHYGGYVDEKSVEDLQSTGAKTFLTDDGKAGIAVTNEGDIEALFRGNGSKYRGVVDDLLITARANGGTKMDCFGRKLVNNYERCGYVPVARVKFDAEYVTDPVLLERQPDVYVLMKNTDDLDTVIDKNVSNEYHLSTQEELDKLPEMEYPEALDYRDDLLARQENGEEVIAGEPQSSTTAEKTTEPTNTSTTEETSLKSPENKNPKDDTITAKEDIMMDAVDNLDDTKMMTTHGDNLSDVSKEQRAKLKNKSAKPKATELAETPEPETPALKDKDFKVSDHVSPEEKASGKAKFNSVITDIRRKLENSMGFSEREAARWAKRNHQPEFAAQFSGLVNNMRQSTQRASYSFLNEQIDYNGNRVGESFSDIAKDIKGKEAKIPNHYDNVQDYLFLVNHADRVDASGMLPGEKGDKRLFDNLTADEARKMAQELIDNDPDLLKDANRIIRYFRNDLKSQAQAGLISWDTFYHYIDTQPNYVPAHRSGFGTAKLGGKPYEPNLKSLRAKGSGLDLLPIEDQAKLSAEYTFTRGSTNDVSKAIAKMSGYSEDALKLYDDTDGVDATDVALFFDKKNGRLRFFDNGELKSVEVPQQYLKDIEDAHISATSSEGLNAVLNLFGGGNRIFKALITSYNPAFVVKNFFRDFPEGALQSQNMGLYFKNLGLGKSAVSLASNDEWARAYKRMGGQHGQFINSAQDIFKEENWLKKNTLGRIEAMNELTEQMPRLAEFRAYLEKLGKTPKTATPDELRRAAEAAADVTVNFGRSGSIGRIINKSVVPFFNPAVQGFAKIGRVLTKDKSVSGYVKLLSKMAVLGAGPELVNEMIIGDNPNYQMINERDRAVNYYIPLDADNPLNVLFGSNINGTKDGEVFLKIPKARFLSIVGMGTQKAMGTNDIPFVDFLKISKDQIGPVGVSNNIFQQFINSGVMNNDSKGKTWYGAEIENTGDQNKEAKDRYDEKTSIIAKELGRITGRSPKKIDYLLDSYTGVIGDIALPATASAAQRGGSGPVGAVRSFLAKNFSTDSVSSNNLTNKVYERVDELTQKKGSGDTSAETEYGLSYFNKRNAKASEIRDKIRSIQNSSKSKEQKAREVRPLQRELNKLNKTTLDTEKSFVKAAKKYVDRLSNAPLADETKKNYGIENAMIATAKDRGEDPWKLVKEYTKQSKYRPKYAKYAKAAGLSPVEYKEFYNLREYDLDQSGGMPSKKEATTYLNSRDDLTQEQKAVLYAGLGGWLAKGPNPYGSVGGSRVGSGGSGGRRYGSRRRYSSRRSSGGSRKSTSGKAVGATTTTNKPKSVKLTSVADIMKSSNSKTATASALAKILKSSTQADYEAAAKKAVSKKKKDIYKISAKRT